MLGSTSERAGALLGPATAALVERGRARDEVPKDDSRDTRRREYMVDMIDTTEGVVLMEVVFLELDVPPS